MAFGINRYPALLIGQSVIDFKKGNTLPIKHVETLGELQDVVAYYSGISYLENPLIIGDISFIRNSDSVLLKFLEESDIPVVLLSYYDNISPVLLSRMAFVSKRPLLKTSSEFLPLSKGIPYLSKAESPADKYKIICEKSPILYYFEKNIKSKKLKDRFYKAVSVE